MTWLEDLTTERTQAQTEQSNLIELSRQSEQKNNELDEERRALNYLIRTSEARLRKLSIEIRNAKESHSNLAGKLYQIERKIGLTNQLIKGQNQMDFFKLPPEIQEMILKLVLVKDRIVKLISDPYQDHERSETNRAAPPFDSSDLQILRTCEAMYRLGRNVFYRHNAFMLDSHSIRNAYTYKGRPWDPPKHWPSTPLMLQHLIINVRSDTDLPDLSLVVGECVSLKSLGFIIDSVPKSLEAYKTTHFHVGPDVLLSVAVSPEAVSPKVAPEKAERAQRACQLLLSALRVVAKPPGRGGRGNQG